VDILQYKGKKVRITPEMREAWDSVERIVTEMWEDNIRNMAAGGDPYYVWMRDNVLGWTIIIADGLHR
jgi:hypothetical protein